MRRRDFLSVPVALALIESPAAEVVLNAADGAVLYSTGNATAWILPPGSTIKPFTLQALLEAKRISTSDRYLCPGQLYVAGRNLTCSHPRGLPPMDVTGAIAYSCNCAVAHFAQRFSPPELTNALQRAGFRARTANPLLQAIGEDGVFVTPLELAQAYRRLSARINAAVLAGLEGAVAFGTAQAAAVPGTTIAGKTGTGLHVAWFAGFAPSRSPHLVVVVAMQGRSGGADAAPIAAELFRKYSGPTYRVRIRGQIIELPVERYVAAVLAGEASVFRQQEALKAMAVTARSYAMHERGRHATEGFDFCNTTHCQRAEPQGINAAMEAAVSATTGQVLRYRGEVAFTPYTMNCGGLSEDAQTVWPDVHAPYLRIHSDPNCQPAMWSRTIPLTDVARAIESGGLTSPQPLERVSVVERTASGRARRVALDGRVRVLLDAGSFRFAIGRALGWDLIRSNWFDIECNDGQITIHGKGEGHGIGLCQQGAEQMAARGQKYRTILAFYYPGASTLEWVRLGGESITLYATDPGRERVVLTEAERLSRTLPWPIGGVEVYIYPTIEDFENSTAEPGWVAAHTQGSRIDLQPLRTLQERNIFSATLHHELLHVAVETRAHPSLPVWFREGIVEWLAGSRGPIGAAIPADSELRQRTDRATAERAYGEARAEVAALVDRYGETTVLGWVSRGLPADVKNSISSKATTNRR